MKAPNALLELRASVVLDDYVADIAWSNDARRLAIAGGEGKMFLVEFDAERLRPREIGEHGLGALAVAWQPGGDAFVSSGQDSALVAWDGSSGAVLQQPTVSTTGAVLQQPAWAAAGVRTKAEPRAAAATKP